MIIYVPPALTLTSAAPTLVWYFLHLLLLLRLFFHLRNSSGSMVVRL